MDEHRELTDQTVDEAYQYVFAMLTSDEADAYEQHLLTGCQLCIAHVQEFQSLLEVLAADVEPVAPPLRVRSALLRRIEKQKQSTIPEGYTVSLCADSPWESMQVPGVRRRELAAEKGFRSFLVEFDPGATFPAHKHSGVEHCYVVWGDLISGPIRLGKGDFQRAEQDTMHAELRSENGCLLLITVADPGDLITH